MKKKLIVLILASAMMVGTLAACGGNNAGNAGSAKTSTAASAADTKTDAASDANKRDVGGLKLPLTENGETLHAWIVWNNAKNNDPNQVASVQEFEKNTGVHMEWTVVGNNEIAEKMGTMLANGDYPDIVYPGSNGYPGGIKKGVEDGVIYPDMDKLIRENMPNYMALLDANDDLKRQATGDDGKLDAVHGVVMYDDVIKGEPNYIGMVYRADILEKLGIEMPTTVDEWHDAFKAAKEAGVVTDPFNLFENGGSPFSLAFGVDTIGGASGRYVQLENGQIVYGPYKEGFKEYLETMRQWYAEGLINPNYASFNFYLDTPGSVEIDQCLAYSYVISNFTGPSYYNMHMVTNENVYLQPVLAPVLAEGDETRMSFNHVLAKDPVFVTTSCKTPELAAQWMDYSFSKEGSIYNWYGIEGETYTIGSDGTPEFTDAVFGSDTMSPSEYLQQYAMDQSTWFGLNQMAAGVQLNTRLGGGVNYNQMAAELWDSADVNYALPLLTLTDEEGTVANRKMTDMQTLVEEYMANYITGGSVEPFEAFQAKLKQYGMDEVLEIYQGAYERYMNR